MIYEHLFPFQKEDVDALSDVLIRQPGCLIFNEMGTGKTIEALALVERLKPERVLVVCPNTLKLQWWKQVSEWLFPSSAPTTFFSVAHYEQFQTISLHQTFKWDMVILDEAHRVRNMEGKASQNILSMKSDCWLLLTGTPIVNSAFDVYPLLTLVGWTALSSQEFHDYFVFTRRYPHPYRGGYIERDVGVKHAHELRSLLSEYGVQRKKVDVLPDLPPLLEQEIPLEMTGAQRDFYDYLEKEALEAYEDGNVYEGFLTKMREACCDPRLISSDYASSRGVKTEAFDEYVDSCGSEPFVVFSTFERYITMLEITLIRKRVPYVRLTGKESTTVRDDGLEMFKAGLAQCVIGTVQTAGEGIDLSRASLVLMVDRWWSPAMNAQAVSRLHRWGQKKSVSASYFVVKDSIDEVISRVLKRKQGVADKLEIINALVKWRRK